MPLAVLRKLRDMVTAGAMVVGPKPIESPSLSDDAAEFATIANQLWGGTTGKGKVLTGSLADALASLKVAADFGTRSRSPTLNWRSCTASGLTATSTG